MKKLVLFVAGLFLLFAGAPQLAVANMQPTSYLLTADPEAKSFTGTVMKKGDDFVLSDAANKISYVLDDAQKASQFEGKKVKVTGTVDTASNTIHVESIEEVA